MRTSVELTARRFRHVASILVDLIGRARRIDSSTEVSSQIMFNCVGVGINKNVVSLVPRGFLDDVRTLWIIIWLNVPDIPITCDDSSDKGDSALVVSFRFESSNT